MLLYSRVQSRAGFSLLEVVLSVGIFVLFAVGIYSGIQFVFKSVYQSRLRIIETALLNEQAEIVRNLAFHDVGILLGSPSGLLARTVTTTRNGIDFVITRTIRNIDDTFDGTIGGTPNDTAPADYKLVEIEVVCLDCGQARTVSMVTTVGPRHLEGDPTHGALFVQVFDANAVPITDAEVHIVATSTSPAYDFIDTTDSDGMLRIVDLAAGTEAYHITVSKDGYTTDATVAPSDTVPNPVKAPATVVAQDVTEISFWIDRISEIALTTINAGCLPVGSVDVNLVGEKLIGTSPDVPKVDEMAATDASDGNWLFSPLEWDAYSLRLQSGSAYDLIGTIPQAEVTLGPGASQPIQFLVGPNTTRSLIVNVRDSVTLQPVPTATVTVTTSYSTLSQPTGVGFVRQTDWSQGSGQTDMGNPARYFAETTWTDETSSPGDVKLEWNGVAYGPNAELESSTFDLGLTPTYVNLVWEPLGQPEAVGTSSVLFQLATATSTNPPAWDFIGPGGTNATYYTPSDTTIYGGHTGDRYVRYKLFLSTLAPTSTPVVSDVNITYTNSCTPPGQAYFGGLGAETYTVTVEKTGYESQTNSVTVSGDEFFTVDLIPQ